MQAGMYGSFIVEDPNDPIREKFPYEREYTLLYSAHDVNFLREEMNSMLERMKERMYLVKNGRFDKERFAVFDTKEEFIQAVENGYQPPYVVNRRAPDEFPAECGWLLVRISGTGNRNLEPAGNSAKRC